MKKNQSAKKSRQGFTMIELMIIVGIIGVLSAVAIPQYIMSVRRSYLSEVTSGFAAIKNAEESFMTSNGCYVDAIPWPATMPQNGIGRVWDTASGAWAASGLNVRPDRTVRFQYQIYASNAWSNGCGTANAKTYIGADRGLGCITNATVFIPDSVYTPGTSNWYVVVARGDLNGDGVASNIFSAIDDSAIVMCNELE
jgi:prepilin-type N-terminal cleavage/methylation domain-containing protein